MPLRSAALAIPLGPPVPRPNCLPVLSWRSPRFTRQRQYRLSFPSPRAGVGWLPCEPRPLQLWTVCWLQPLQTLLESFTERLHSWPFAVFRVCVCVCVGTCINNAKATASDENGIQSSSGRDGSFFCGQRQSLNSVNIICWHLNMLKFAPTLPSHHTRSKIKEPWTWGEALPLYSSSLFTSRCRAAPDPWLTLMPSPQHHFLLTLGREDCLWKSNCKTDGTIGPQRLESSRKTVQGNHR